MRFLLSSLIPHPHPSLPLPATHPPFPFVLSGRLVDEEMKARRLYDACMNSLFYYKYFGYDLDAASIETHDLFLLIRLSSESNVRLAMKTAIEVCFGSEHVRSSTLGLRHVGTVKNTQFIYVYMYICIYMYIYMHIYMH